MTTAISRIQSGPRSTTVARIWENAIRRYEDTTGSKIQSLAQAKTLDDVVKEIQDKRTSFGKRRHDNSRVDRLRTLVARVLLPIDNLSKIVTQACSNSPPAVAIFTAVRLLIAVANNVSADYDKLTHFFDELSRYIERLKILQDADLPDELQCTIAEILTSVLVLCGIATKYIRKNRFVKAFGSFFSGEDDELNSALLHFRDMIEHEMHMKDNITFVKSLEAESQQTAILSHLQRQDTGIDRETLLTELSSLDFEAKQNDTHMKRSEGTGEWLVQSNAFQQWFRNNCGSAIWCHGIPGSGKTVLMSIAVNYVSENTDASKVAIVYLYCDYKDSKTHSELQLLSSIARQLSNHSSQIPQPVRDFRDKIANKKRGPTGDEWISLIRQLLEPFKQSYVFIDALDECPERNRDKFLQLLQKLQSSIHLFLTSRPIDLPVELTNIAKVEATARSSDVRKYLESEILARSRLRRLAANDSNLKEDIIECLTKNAAGMFLLVHLHLDRLCGYSSARQIRQAMHTLPSGLEDFYSDAMLRVSNQGEGDCGTVRRALSFIFCAKRPLTVTELCHALAVEDEDRKFHQNALVAPELLVSTSLGLIRIDNQGKVIRLAHHTLQEYFEKHPHQLLPYPDMEFANVCLTYLSYDVFGTGPCRDGDALERRLQEYQFLDYASRYWGDHVKERLFEQKDMVMSYMQDKERSSSSVQVLYATSRVRKNWFNRFPRNFGALHMGAYWGLKDVMDLLLKTDVDVDTRDSCGGTALLTAAKKGNLEAAILLLEKSAGIDSQNQQGETALHCAVKAGQKKMASLLVEKGAIVMADNDNWTALDWAVVNRDMELVALLMKRCKDSGVEGGIQEKALFLAAEEGQAAITHSLLSNGINVNAQDESGSTALDFAVSVGHEGTVRTLLHDGANVNSVDRDGNTALHWSITQEEIARLLLESGAHVQTQNHTGQTALCWAAQGGTVEVAQLLLEYNSNVNWQDLTGGTALHKASLRGSEPMVHLLLEHGAMVDLEDEDGWTPLHAAGVKGHTGIIGILSNRMDGGAGVVELMTQKMQNASQWPRLLKMAEEKGRGSTVLTGLRLAAQEAQLGRLEVLLEKGADVNGKDAAGYTALELASFQGHTAIVELLLEHGADVNLRGSDSCPPLYFAIQQDNEGVVSLLLQHGADVNTNVYGSTVMELVAETGNASIAEDLILAGANLNWRDYSGRTALHWAALHGRDKNVHLLLDQGVDLDLSDDRGMTALMLAVENLQYVVSMLLIDGGASLTLQNHSGYTVFQIADIIGNEAMIWLLKQRGAGLSSETSHTDGSQEPHSRFERLLI